MVLISRQNEIHMLVDRHNRRIRYLRVSVTARCNLGCRYCLPPVRTGALDPESRLSDEEILRLCRLLAFEGVEKIRITGGEPLLRPGLANLISAIAAIPGIRNIGLTTNGVLLKNYADDLAEAGVRRINISLDSLREDRFAAITRGGVLRAVLEGIAAAEEADLRPIKLNCVVMRGVNDDEAPNFARLTLRHAWQMRFIELMPIGPAADSWERLFVSSSETRDRIAEFGPLIQTNSHNPAARPVYQLPEAKGSISFISPVTEPFCTSCDRLRLMSNGELRPCLCADASADLGSLMASGASDAELMGTVRQVLADKPLCGSAELVRPRETVMAAIGG